MVKELVSPSRHRAAARFGGVSTHSQCFPSEPLRSVCSSLIETVWGKILVLVWFNTLLGDGSIAEPPVASLAAFRHGSVQNGSDYGPRTRELGPAAVRSSDNWYRVPNLSVKEV